MDRHGVALVTNFMERGSAHTLLVEAAQWIPAATRWPLSMVDIVRLCHQAANGIVFMHALSPPVLHRDIAARNLLVSGRGSALVCHVSDFGFARVKEELAQASHVTKTREKPVRFTAPEVFQTSATNEASDVYAFGVTLYELLLGANPWKTRRRPYMDTQEVTNRVYEGLRPPLPPPPLLDAALARVIASAWAHAPVQRPTMAAVRAALEEWLVAHDVPGDAALEPIGEARHAETVACVESLLDELRRTRTQTGVVVPPEDLLTPPQGRPAPAELAAAPRNVSAFPLSQQPAPALAGAGVSVSVGGESAESQTASGVDGAGSSSSNGGERAAAAPAAALSSGLPVGTAPPSPPRQQAPRAGDAAVPATPEPSILRSVSDPLSNPGPVAVGGTPPASPHSRSRAASADQATGLLNDSVDNPRGSAATPAPAQQQPLQQRTQQQPGGGALELLHRNASEPSDPTGLARASSIGAEPESAASSVPATAPAPAMQDLPLAPAPPASLGTPALSRILSFSDPTADAGGGSSQQPTPPPLPLAATAVSSFSSLAPEEPSVAAGAAHLHASLPAPPQRPDADWVVGEAGERHEDAAPILDAEGAVSAAPLSAHWPLRQQPERHPAAGPAAEVEEYAHTSPGRPLAAEEDAAEDQEDYTESSPRISARDEPAVAACGAMSADPQTGAGVLTPDMSGAASALDLAGLADAPAPGHAAAPPPPPAAAASMALEDEWDAFLSMGPPRARAAAAPAPRSDPGAVVAAAEGGTPPAAGESPRPPREPPHPRAPLTLGPGWATPF